jgi:hypothetical protein
MYTNPHSPTFRLRGGSVDAETIQSGLIAGAVLSYCTELNRAQLETLCHQIFTKLSGFSTGLSLRLDDAPPLVINGRVYKLDLTSTTAALVQIEIDDTLTYLCVKDELLELALTVLQDGASHKLARVSLADSRTSQEGVDSQWQSINSLNSNPSVPNFSKITAVAGGPGKGPLTFSIPAKPTSVKKAPAATASVVPSTSKRGLTDESAHSIKMVVYSHNFRSA